ncbi:efflux RND transporter periplasmic adaptor subunit [Hymenobacter cellulosilyticus]|uniref:Efflux RND transporter periplasmic adaptor subunit n=1 Tax=Hymenobacter cellulosilyticus TaxID=2932248 RepID=A0A8T9Q9M6_9BACT|nr:efflux RND transporter periplasmic adaptor subunit [Hymenobacter cellulosilyticus]UOQ72828.1 efflux RND transporter periplasmic adaptor subunit [Hymenobacter cellulosilyticus]
MNHQALPDETTVDVEPAAASARSSHAYQAAYQPPKTPLITMKRIFLGILVLLLLAGFGWLVRYFWKQAHTDPVTYKTETPFVADIVKKTVATGSIVPRREVQIKPQVSGIVEELFVEAGEPIKEGQLIARIRTVANAANVNNAQNNIQAARVALETSQIELDRQRPLFEQKVIAEQEYNRLLADVRAKKQALDAAQNDLQIAQRGASRNTGGASNTVRSTITGLVLDVPIKVGSSVVERNNFNEGTTIAAIADMKSLVFEGKVDESEVGKVREGMDLNLTVGALEGENFPATLEYIAPKGITEEGAIKFQVRANVRLQPGQFLRAGYSANGDIVLGRRKQVLAIRESLLQFGKVNKDSVFVEVETAPQQFQKRLVKTGLSDGINVEVLSGLTKTDKVKVLGPPAEGEKKG